MGWVDECINWPTGEALTSYQRELLAALPIKKRIAIRGPHGLGKTALQSLAVLWFSTTREAAGIDWKIPTTASAWRQLSKYLWPEVHKWARRLRWDRLGFEPFNPRTELLDMSLKLEHGEAFAVASDTPELVEGAHASSLLYLFDESKTIPDETFDAAEGAFSSGVEAFALCASTPGEPRGRFYEIHRRASGFEDWWPRHVTQAEALAAGRMRADWAEQRKRQWGEQSAVYQNRVLGEFAAADEDGIIPLAWIELANERWLTRFEANEWEPFTCVGVDVARSGEDRTILALRHGSAIKELRESSKEDTMQTTGRVVGVLRAHGGRAVVDVEGIGAGVVDRTREQGFPVVAFNAGAGALQADGRTKPTDRSGELEFVNMRAWAWWNLRELLDPANGAAIALPPDDLLTGDLTAPRQLPLRSGGRIQIESKEEIRKRIHRSTDRGDAVVQAFLSLDAGGPGDHELREAEERVAALTLALKQNASDENRKAFAAAQQALADIKRRIVGSRVGFW